MNSRDEQEKPLVSPAPDATRRRLIKGGASLPLVASLAPNAALAATSAVNCTLTGVSNMKFDVGNSVNGDNAVRKLVTFYRLDNGNGNNGRNGFYKIDGKYYENGGQQVYPTDTKLDTLETEDAWVLALYDVTVNPPVFVGYWPETQVAGDTATALSGSCWTSIKPVGGGPIVGGT